MTKKELIEQIQGMPDNAIIGFVITDGITGLVYECDSVSYDLILNIVVLQGGDE